MLTNGSLQGVTILKDKILEDNTGVASHPDKRKQIATTQKVVAISLHLVVFFVVDTFVYKMKNSYLCTRFLK